MGYTNNMTIYKAHPGSMQQHMNTIVIVPALGNTAMTSPM